MSKYCPNYPGRVLYPRSTAWSRGFGYANLQFIILNPEERLASPIGAHEEYGDDIINVDLDSFRGTSVGNYQLPSR